MLSNTRVWQQGEEGIAATLPSLVLPFWLLPLSEETAELPPAELAAHEPGACPSTLFWSQAPLPACGAWQSPHPAPATSLGTETEQGMRLAPEPVILALQTYGRDQRVRPDNFSQPYLILAPLRLYRHLQWGRFPGQAAQTARDLKRRHGWRCPTAKWPFPAQIIGKRKTKRGLA